MSATTSPRTPRDDLVKLRQERGLTLREAADQIGVTARVVSNAEKGHRCHPHNRRAIASFYGADETALFPAEAAG